MVVNWIMKRLGLCGLTRRLSLLGGKVLARSEFEPEPCDFDAFGDVSQALFSIVRVDIDPEAFLSALSAAMADGGAGQVLVVDFTRKPSQVRVLPTTGPDRIVLKAATRTWRLGEDQRWRALQIVRELLRRDESLRHAQGASFLATVAKAAA